MLEQQLSDKRRIPGLDGLRALSIVLVLISHLRTLPGFPRWSWLMAIATRGQIGVDIFFVISGFLITWLLLQEEARTDRINLNQFYVRRAFRILPPAFSYLAFVTLLVLLHISSSTYRDIGAAALFFRNFGDNGHLDTGHFWSLAIEEQFYLTWPFLLVFLRKQARIPAVLVLIAMSTLFRYEYYRFFPHATIGVFEFHYDGLLVGCLLALAQQTLLAGYLNGKRVRSGWVAWAAVGIVMLVISPIADKFPGRLTACIPGIEGICIALVINFLIQPRVTLAHHVFDAPPVMWLGRLSYSLYLWQQLFCFRPGALACSFPLNISLGLACAIFSYYCIEQPALRLRQGRRSRRPLPQLEPALLPVGS